MLVSFLRPENNAVFKSIFFLRDSPSYMWFQLKKILFLGYEHFLSVGWIKKCPFLKDIKLSAGELFVFLGTSWRKK